MDKMCVYMCAVYATHTRALCTIAKNVKREK